jgi:hypothetical protein
MMRVETSCFILRRSHDIVSISPRDWRLKEDESGCIVGFEMPFFILRPTVPGSNEICSEIQLALKLGAR